jgi:hypothetical protein
LVEIGPLDADYSWAGSNQAERYEVVDIARWLYVDLEEIWVRAKAKLIREP